MTKEKRTFQVFLNEGFPLIAQKFERNKPCPCKSGKKAKKCCGTETRYYTTKPKSVPEPAPELTGGDKMKALLHCIAVNGEISLTEIREYLDPEIYNNDNKYLGVMLSRLIQRGQIKRVDKGVYQFVQFTRKTA